MLEKKSIEKNAVLLVGLQGAGKSTVVFCLKERHYLSLGMSDAILWRTDNSQTFADKYPRAEFYDIGEPYPDAAVTEAFFARISSTEGMNLVLDGCIRSINQVDTVVGYLKGEGYRITVIHLICSAEECKARIARRVAYDETHGRPVRSDDKDPAAIERRFQYFFSTIDGILSRLQEHQVVIHDVDTEMPPEIVQAEVLQKIGSRTPVIA